jgi:hypothetical protein
MAKILIPPIEFPENGDRSLLVEKIESFFNRLSECRPQTRSDVHSDQGSLSLWENAVLREDPFRESPCLDPPIRMAREGTPVGPRWQDSVDTELTSQYFSFTLGSEACKKRKHFDFD